MPFRDTAGAPSRRQRVKGMWALAIAAALGLAVAACSSSSPSSSGSQAGSSTQSVIRVMTVTQVGSPAGNFPQATDAAEARVKAINAAGGFAGHQIQLDVCNGQGNPNTEAGCVREAKANNDVAIVGSLTVFPGTYSLLKSTDIPLIGGWAILPQDFSTPNVYHYTSGVPGWFGGMAALLKLAGAKTFATIECDSPACSYAAATVKQFAAMGGLTQVGVQSVPMGATDVDPVVAKVVAAHPQGIVLAEDTQDVVPILASLQQAGYHGVLVSDTGAVNPSAQAAAGTAANGLLLTSQVKARTDISDPAVRQFLAEMKAQDPKAVIDDNSEIVWGSWYLFQQLGMKIPSGTAIDPKTISDALDNLKAPLATGVGAPFTTATKSPVEGAPRLFSSAVFVQQIKDGKLVPYGSGEINFLSVLGQ
jgi:branched-chain amino acid transport system substrate-binding protein